jgi:AcrR family transcriptional regulator
MFSTEHLGKNVRKAGELVKQDKQDRRSLRTRRLVTAAMMELLLEQRYDTITVQDILDRAGIGRSTFYVHYFDKEDVLASIVEQMLETFRGELSQRDGGHGLIPSLALFRHVYLHPRREQFRAMTRGRAGELLIGVAQTALGKGIEQALGGDFSASAEPTVPLTVLTQYLAGTFLNLFAWWLEADMPYTPEQMDSFFQYLALPGVRGVLDCS